MPIANAEGSASSLVFEGKRDTRAECGDLSVLHLHVHLGHFRDAQITQRAGCRFHGVAAGILPRRLADTDHVDDPVDRVRLLFGHRILRRSPPPALGRAAMLTPSAARTHRGTSYRPWFLFTGRGVRKCAIFISPGTNRLHVLSPSSAASSPPMRQGNHCSS